MKREASIPNMGPEVPSTRSQLVRQKPIDNCLEFHSGRRSEGFEFPEGCTRSVMAERRVDHHHVFVKGRVNRQVIGAISSAVVDIAGVSPRVVLRHD